MTTKEFLQQAYIAHKEVGIKLEQIETLQALATRTTTVIKDVPTGRPIPSSRVESAVVLIYEQIDRLEDEVSRLIEVTKKIAATIAAVKNPIERTILEYRYLCFTPWGTIAQRMNLSVNRIFRIHNRALKNFSASEVNASKNQ